MSEMPSAEGYHAMEDSGITYSSPEYHSLYFLQCIVFLPAIAMPLEAEGGLTPG